MISLISLSNPPNEKEIKFLYFLLKNRNASISHKKLPSFEDHRKFVLNHPYKTWNIVIKGNTHIGAQYIGFNNTVGIHLLPEYVVYRRNVITKVLENFSPEPGITSLIPNQFIFNVSVSDYDYVDDLLKLGAEQIQSTFQFRKKDV
ncbi:hypothetical protein CU311_06685 [Prochlorococcus marinus str. MU1402]|uniref:hypothetical protein n=1 Tax=Prochlorococcus marinus TaxID=1219 RepID=UPI001ADC2D87|nr:hypothetical protein [Prochlorococcus marinus]MBO8232365.1 hypothetical protein [Prochlorococcus marinus XMU1402]MBW3057093.1 hypothetical protein [Prochlorococcus marinus str. MU1402]